MPRRTTRPPTGPLAFKVYRDRANDISFLYPDGWTQFELEVEGGSGVLFAPDPEDVATCLSCEVRELGTEVTAADLPTLRRGFLAGLRRVPGSRLERQQHYDVGFLIGVEARQRFREGDVERKRWVRVLYRGSRQVRLIAQGRTVAEYERYDAVWGPAMTNFMFGDVRPEAAPGDVAPDWLDSILKPG